MELLHEFTENERQVIDEARQNLEHTYQLIARIHGIRGSVAVAADGRGFTAPDGGLNGQQQK